MSSSPCSPRVAAWMGRTGIAMSFAFFEFFALFLPLPAKTISKSGNFALCSTPRPPESFREISAGRRPARAQNHQHSGSPDDVSVAGGVSEGSAEHETKRGTILMAIFKRGRVYWCHFYFNGQHIQKSTQA